MAYIGRFAPSPSGPLHMGSLVTAVASYLCAKHAQGEWWVRIDDIDPPRSDPQALNHIQTCLQAHGLHPHGPYEFQSQHSARYRDALARLSSDLFYCQCSRRSLAKLEAYPGTCRANTTPKLDHAVRVKVHKAEIHFHDNLCGPQQFALHRRGGDFIVKRRDELWAYNLATAVDDGNKYTHVVRGQDLLDTTAAQIYLMQQLGLTIPSYSHIPLLYDNQGAKLSKQHGATAVNNNQPLENLRFVLTLLGQNPQLGTTQPKALLQQASKVWNIANIPAILAT